MLGKEESFWLSWVCPVIRKHTKCGITKSCIFITKWSLGSRLSLLLSFHSDEYTSTLTEYEWLDLRYVQLLNKLNEWKRNNKVTCLSKARFSLVNSSIFTDNLTDGNHGAFFTLDGYSKCFPDFIVHLQLSMHLMVLFLLYWSSRETNQSFSESRSGSSMNHIIHD